MDTVLPYMIGLAVFGLFLLVMVLKEKRTKSRPPQHPCHQIQTCQCKGRASDPNHKCTQHPDEIGRK